MLFLLAVTLCVMVFVHGVHAPFIQDGPLLVIYVNGVKTNP